MTTPMITVKGPRMFEVTRTWHDVAADSAIDAIEVTQGTGHDFVKAHRSSSRVGQEPRRVVGTIGEAVTRLFAALTYHQIHPDDPNGSTTLDVAWQDITLLDGELTRYRVLDSEPVNIT